MDTKTNLIEYLLKRRYGSLAPPPPPTLNSSRATNAEPRRSYQAMLAERAKYEAMSFDEVKTLANQARENDAQVRAVKLRQEDAKLFFNQPTANADFAHWAKMAIWTLDEALALSLGKNPAVVTADAMSMSGESYFPEAWTLSAFPKEYARRRALVGRAVTAGDLPLAKYEDVNGWRSTSRPDQFLAWAANTFDTLPQELVEQVTARGKRVTDLKTVTAERDALAARVAELGVAANAPQTDERPVDERERTSLLRVIRALDVTAKLPERGAASSVEKQLQELGFDGPHEATIRKIIRDARALEK
jgi:hypothetical protein